MDQAAVDQQAKLVEHSLSVLGYRHVQGAVEPFVAGTVWAATADFSPWPIERVGHRGVVEGGSTVRGDGLCCAAGVVRGCGGCAHRGLQVGRGWRAEGGCCGPGGRLRPRRTTATWWGARGDR